MWVLGKLRESMESIPLELNRYMGGREVDPFLSSRTNFSQNLHSNIITPDNIPEFCLPPKLCKRSLQPEAENTLSSETQMQKNITSSRTTQVKTKDVKPKNDDASEFQYRIKKPLPFSAEGYGLAGMFESPNTRRKESLFHSKSQVFMFERKIPNPVSRQVKESRTPKKTFSGFLPLFACKNLSDEGNTERETSFGDSSLFGISYKSPSFIPSSNSRLKESKSCPSLIYSKENSGGWKKGGLSLTTSPCRPPPSEKTSWNLPPPVLLSSDVLQCQEKLQRNHVLPLHGRGRIRLSAEQTFTSHTFSTLYTVRVRVVSVEGLSDETEQQTLNCAVTLCLTPGKLQPQESATIRKCRSPVFNEDFFFTELSLKDLQELQLRLKVKDKPAAGAIRRGTVIGTITKPLSQLLPLKKQT